MSYRNYVHCANRNCEAECGVDNAATFSDSGYIDLHDGAVVDDRTGDVFCSQECYDECNPVFCADCGDEEVRKAGDRCTYCKIAAELGEDAAYAWRNSQLSELRRKPVASVPVAGIGSNVQRRVV